MSERRGRETYVRALRAELGLFEGARLAVDSTEESLKVCVGFGERSVTVTKDGTALEELSGSRGALSAIAAIDARELLFQVGAAAFPRTHAYRNGRGTALLVAHQTAPFVWSVAAADHEPWGVVTVERDGEHHYRARIARQGLEECPQELDSDRAPLPTSGALLDALSRTIGRHVPDALVRFCNP